MTIDPFWPLLAVFALSQIVHGLLFRMLINDAKEHADWLRKMIAQLEGRLARIEEPRA